MATFTNQATLTYNGGTVNSNIVTGELVQVLTASKTAAAESYRTGDLVTYVVQLRRRDAELWRARGDIREVIPGVFVLLDTLRYDPHKGLLAEGDSPGAATLVQ